MKQINRSLLLLAIFGMLLIWSCDDWNRIDPAAGNQVYPKLVLKGEYEFNTGFEEGVVLGSYEEGETPTVVTDSYKGKVAYLNGGYVQFTNPLLDASLQTGFSLTMWTKIEGTSATTSSKSASNLSDVLFSFGNEDGSGYLQFTVNGSLSYYSDGASAYQNTLEDSLFTPDEWHYLSILIQTDGYTVYVDGEMALGVTPTAYDFANIISEIPDMPYFYLGYGSPSTPGSMWIDDVYVYRNEITASQITVPEVDNEGEPYQFPPRGTVGYYLLENSFANSLNASQDGELITSETQATPSDFEIDVERGTVWHQQEGWAGHENGWAYTRFDNPLKSQTLEDGVSVSMWLNPPTLNWWDQIFVLNDGTQKFWFNAIGYTGFHDGGDLWFDCNQNTDANALTVGSWTFVTINIASTGFEVYYNGEFKFSNEDNAQFASALTDYSAVVDLFTSSDNFYLGYESWWKAAPALVDDIFLGTRMLTEDEIMNLYADTQKAYGGVPVNPTYLPSLYGVYPLDNSFDNAINSNQSGELITSETQATPSDFEEDATRGIVWHQQEGWAGNDNGWAYTRFDNPLKGSVAEEGVSVSMWLNPPALNWWDQIFVLNDGTQKFWFNAIGYTGFHDGGDVWFDCNQNTDGNALTTEAWTLVTINVTSSGFEVYYNGEFKFDKDENAAFAGTITDYSTIVDLFTSSDNFYFGYESWWKAAPALIDDVYLCASPLTAEQALALYNATKK